MNLKSNQAGVLSEECFQETFSTISCSVSQFQPLDYWGTQRKKGHDLSDLDTVNIPYYIHVTQENIGNFSG